jgi:endonuclease YncB( thermonuclease family)
MFLPRLRTATGRRQEAASDGRRRLLQGLGAALAPPFAHAGADAQNGSAERTLHGRLIRVQDGDSFLLRGADGARRRIRIAGIDAPEKGQPYAETAGDHLATLLADRPLRLAVIKTDPFGRLVAEVWNGEADVGLALLEAGLAWHFKRYAAEQAAPQRQRYAAAEQRARDDGIGMWREAGLVEPWRFRAQQRRGLAP